MNKDIFKGIIGILALAIYAGKFIYALFAYSSGDFQNAALALLIGMVIEVLAFIYVMRS